eukprot:3262678-Ditylum_brightwellii.AAC.1
MKTTAAPGVKSYLCPDYDVVTEVCSEIKQVPNMLVSWVKAHQDDNKPMCKLALDAQHNCTADRDAKLFRMNTLVYICSAEAPPKLLLNHAYL